MNQVILVGNNVRDIDLKKTTTGKSVCDFTLAVKDGKNTEFVDCVAWELTADNLAKYVKKGSLVCISGKIHSESYEKDGRKIKKTYVLVSNVQFLNSKSETSVDNTQNNSVQSDSQSGSNTIYTQNVNMTLSPDDLPFI